MEWLVILARVLLAAVFCVAAIAKLKDLSGFRHTLAEFRVSPVIARIIARSLPPLEFAIAGFLLPVSTARWAAIGALTIIVFFTVVIIITVAHGHRPTCHCFGQLDSAPVGVHTIVRNAVFGALAGFLVWQGDAASVSISTLTQGWSPTQWIVGLLSVCFGGVVLVEGWLIAHLLRQHGRLLVALDNIQLRLSAAGVLELPPLVQASPGLPVDAAAPKFKAKTLSGEVLTLDGVLAEGAPILLVFSDPQCGPCKELLPQLAAWQRTYTDQLVIVIVTAGEQGLNAMTLDHHGFRFVLIQEDREIAQLYQANATPSAAVVRVNGTIGAPLALGAQAIATLVSEVTRLPESSQGTATTPRSELSHANNVRPVESAALENSLQ